MAVSNLRKYQKPVLSKQAGTALTSFCFLPSENNPKHGTRKPTKNYTCNNKNTSKFQNSNTNNNNDARGISNLP